MKVYDIIGKRDLTEEFKEKNPEFFNQLENFFLELKNTKKRRRRLFCRKRNMK